MMNLPEGDFKAELILSGGTGRVTVQSPADVHIENGVITAEIIWSSPNYDLMIVDGKEYTPVLTDNDSAHFKIELPALDMPLDIQAETVAMTTPHMIDYTLTVSGKQILQNSGGSDCETASEDVSLDLSSIAAMFESTVLTGSSEAVFSEAESIAEPADPSAGLPPFVSMIIGGVIAAALAFVIIAIGRNGKNKRK